MKDASLNKTTEPSSFIHTGSIILCGPLQVCSIGGGKYFLVLVDMGSRYTKNGFFKSKDRKEIG
jgi:hypothetical protein